MADSKFTFTAEVRPICQLGMSASRQAEPDSWLDVSCYVHECELFSGRSRFTDRFEPGTASITFTNENGWADLVGSPSVVATQTMRPGRPIRIGVRGPWGGLPDSTRWLWRGWVDQCAPQYDPVAHDVVVVNCIDAFGEAGSRQAPTGPFQGANENVQGRIHRILDAVNWFPTKRKIDDIDTTVQGTTLGGAASDLMSQAADSDGGVVFGDTDGDVVYRHRNWMLYDPDTPPDFVIGNVDSGFPGIPYQPGYIDPTKGFVYWPDPPPLDSPTVLAVCALGPDGQPDGSLIAQGDSGNLYVEDGQLRFASSGHVWDLGDYPEGGCVGVTFDPNTGEVHRIDDANQDDVWDITSTPAAEVGPEPLTVELVAFSDSGFVDEPQAGLTVGPITPGKGAMLIILGNALCDADFAEDGTTSILLPAADASSANWGGHIAGGPEWTGIGHVATYGDGPEAFGAAAICRDDPGTFSVDVTWLAPHRSRYHIVTVWKVTGYRPDLYDRMKLAVGTYLNNWAAPTPDAPERYGKGPRTLPFVTADATIPQYTKLADIAIAQSLAESPNPPFGATFNVVEGVWVTPFDTAVAAHAVGTFCDEFDVPNGLLTVVDENWVTPTFSWGFADTQPFSVAGGAVVTAEDPTPGGGDVYGFTHYATAVPGTQTIEATITQTTYAVQRYVLLAEANNGNSSSVGLYVEAESSGAWFWSLRQFDASGVWNAYDDVEGTVTGVTYPATLKLETVGGVVTGWINGVELGSFTETIVTGAKDRVGFAYTWHHETGGVGTQPRFESVCVGSGGIDRKCSWVAGYRQLTVASTVSWDEVNAGPDDIQSTQSQVVVEWNKPPVFGWNVLDYNVIAPTAGTLLPSGGTQSGTIRVDPNAIVLVFVGVMNGTDISADINVSSSQLTFTRARQQTKSDPLSHGQGAIFWAKTPKTKFDPANPPTYTISWGAHTIEKLAYAAYQVTNAGTVDAHGGTTRGTHGDGSVDGGATVLLSAAPASSSATLGFIMVGTTLAAGAGATPGADFIEELEYLPSALAWLQVQSRESSTSNLVVWDDMQVGGSHASDAVLMAIEITPGPDFAFWQDNFAPLVIGGSQDAYNGPIFSAQRRSGLDPNGGDLIWSITGPV